MISFISFDDDLSFKNIKFFRNNRSTGQKSLRCFPRCCEKGHQAQGFCGQSIYAAAVFSKTSVPIESIMIVGEIRPELEPGLAGDVGRKFPKDEFLTRIRSSSTYANQAQLLPGTFSISSETEEEYSVIIVINEPLYSYDYSWKSTRWTSGTVKHVIDIVVLSDDGESTMTVLDSSCSEPFVVSSTKKKTQVCSKSQLEEVIPLTGEKRKDTSLFGFGPSSGKKINRTNFYLLSSLSYWPAAEAFPTTSGGGEGGGGEGGGGEGGGDSV